MSYNVLCILLMLLSISLAQSIFYVEGRHRWAVEPLILIFTAAGILSFMPFSKKEKEGTHEDRKRFLFLSPGDK